MDLGLLHVPAHGAKNGKGHHGGAMNPGGAVDIQAGSGVFPQQSEIRDRVHSMARFYGLLAGVKYAEPFVQKEVELVDDLLNIPVQSL